MAATVIVTLGANGAMWGEEHVPPHRVCPVDTTGAGDAFAVGFLCGLLRGEPPARALARAVVSASFAIEDWGAAALLRATPEAANERLRDWFGA